MGPKIQDGGTPPLIWKKVCLRHDATKSRLGQSKRPAVENLKRTVFTMLQCIYEPINTKSILFSLPEIVYKVSLCIVEHLPLVFQ